MENHLDYKLLRQNDEDILILTDIFKMPQISRYISIDYDNFFNYVTNTENVYFYKIYYLNKLVGCVQTELYCDILYIALIVIPEFQRMGFGTQIVKDIIDMKTGLSYSEINVSVDKTNIPSLKILKKLGFIQTGTDEELIELSYKSATH